MPAPAQECQFPGTFECSKSVLTAYLRCRTDTAQLLHLRATLRKPLQLCALRD